MRKKNAETDPKRMAKREVVGGGVIPVYDFGGNLFLHESVERSGDAVWLDVSVLDASVCHGGALRFSDHQRPISGREMS